MQKIFDSKQISYVFVIVLLFFIGGIYIGYHNRPEIDKVMLHGKETPVTIKGDFSPFWKVWNTINEKYPKADKVSDQDKVYGAIQGLVGSLGDPYSVFFTPDEAKSFEEEIAGNFTGIGMEVGIKNKVLTVIAPLKNTPAYRAGIKPGDKILKINDTVTAGLSVEEAIKMIRGDKGTTVRLTIQHEDSSPIELKIVRDVIDIPTLDSELLPNGVFVIKLYSFSANSADLFRDAIQKFSKTGSDKLILDLRGNPGGYLEAAVDISSWFLPKGQVVVTEDYGANKDKDVFRSRGYDVFTDKLKFVVLIDSGSASASEIVAGALQDHKKATLVGQKSFGKGSVQEAINITPDTLLKITVARWLTPNGTSISEKGLTPDYAIEMTKEDQINKKDPQMDKALQILLAK